MSPRRRSIWDAIVDKVVELVDSVDISKVLEQRKPKKLPPVLLKSEMKEPNEALDDPDRTAER